MSDELREAIEQVFADADKMDIKKHKNVLGDKWRYINAVVEYINNKPLPTNDELRDRMARWLRTYKLDEVEGEGADCIVPWEQADTKEY